MREFRLPLEVVSNLADHENIGDLRHTYEFHNSDCSEQVSHKNWL